MLICDHCQTSEGVKPRVVHFGGGCSSNRLNSSLIVMHPGRDTVVGDLCGICWDTRCAAALGLFKPGRIAVSGKAGISEREAASPAKPAAEPDQPKPGPVLRALQYAVVDRPGPPYDGYCRSDGTDCGALLVCIVCGHVHVVVNPNSPDVPRKCECCGTSVIPVDEHAKVAAALRMRCSDDCVAAVDLRNKCHGSP